MNKPPESFGIMRDAKNPLWDKYISWLNEISKDNYTGTNDEYYFWNGTDKYAASTPYKPNTILTLEQWDSIVNGWQPKCSSYR